MGGQKPVIITENNADVDTNKLETIDPAAAARKRTPKLALYHHSATQTRKGTYFVVKAKSAYADPVVVTNALLFIVAMGGLLNVDVFNSIFKGNPAQIAAAIVALLVSAATIALRIFYSKTPLTLRN